MALGPACDWGIHKDPASGFLVGPESFRWEGGAVKLEGGIFLGGPGEVLVRGWSLGYISSRTRLAGGCEGSAARERLVDVAGRLVVSGPD